MHTRFVIAVTLIILILAGAGYYFFVYQPTHYAKAVLDFADQVGLRYQTLFQANVKDVSDYDEGMKILDDRVKLLAEMKAQIQTLKSPTFGEGKVLQEDLEGFAADFSGVLADAKATLIFLSAAADLRKSFGRGQQSFSDSNALTMGDLVRYMDGRTPKIQDQGFTLFHGKIPKLADSKQFEKLKSSWEEAGPTLDTLRAMTHRLDPNLSLVGFPTSLLSPDESLANQKIEKFQKLLDETLRDNSVNDVLSYRVLSGRSGVLPEPLAERSERIQQAIKKIKTRYGK